MKKTNKGNQDADTQATHLSKLIHANLSGPVDPMVNYGFNYAMIFVHDYFGCTFAYLLKEKFDASKATEKFLADVNQHGKVKTFSVHADVFPAGIIERRRSALAFKSLLTKHRIKHELSAPHSLHQNGTAEHNWQTLFDVAPALLAESGLPKYLWKYALMKATHIRNRCYVQRFKNTPYSLITGL